jgi:hypothetical protein
MRVGRQRAVIEGQDDFVVVERQRFPIIVHAEEGMLPRIDRDRAAGAERTRIPRAVGRHGRSSASHSGQHAINGDCAAHAPKRPQPVLDNPGMAPGDGETGTLAEPYWAAN